MDYISLWTRIKRILRSYLFCLNPEYNIPKYSKYNEHIFAIFMKTL